jgi:hypothetical protein
MPCQKAWCGPCYDGSELKEFPVMEPEDEDGFVTLKNQDKHRFLIGRKGDHLTCPFQCDLCHFRNIQSRNPIETKVEDIRLLRCIRRANLDAMWSRETQTVTKNYRLAVRAIDIATALGIEDPFPVMGPFPLHDIFGMSAAVVILTRSLDVGKYAATVQYGTMRKMRGMFSNAFHASAEGYCSSSVMAKDTRKLMLTECPTYGTFFELFSRGCHKRMGDIVKPDRALSLPILHHIMSLVEKDWKFAGHCEKYRYAMEGAFYLIAYCGALRGEEVPMSDLNSAFKHWDDGVADPMRKYVAIGLMGRFKNQIGEKFHFIPLAANTKSELKVREWVGRLLDEYRRMGIFNGPMFRTTTGQPIKAGSMEEGLFARLERTQEERPDLIPPDVDVTEEYGVYRSFRRGATSEATNRGVKREVIETNNRWWKVERAEGKHTSSSMHEHYTDVRLIVDQLLIFSMSL